MTNKQALYVAAVIVAAGGALYLYERQKRKQGATGAAPPGLRPDVVVPGVTVAPNTTPGPVVKLPAIATAPLATGRDALPPNGGIVPHGRPHLSMDVDRYATRFDSYAPRPTPYVVGAAVGSVSAAVIKPGATVMGGVSAPNRLAVSAKI